MAKLRVPLARNQWFRDHEGIWTFPQHKDATHIHTLDYSAAMDELGDTISSVAFTDQGVTTSSSSVSSNVVTVTVAGTDGYVENTLTTSGGRTMVYTYRFVGPPLGRNRVSYDYKG